MKLKTVVAPAQALSTERREAMWALFRGYYDGVERSTFERDLANKDDVILLFDTGDGSLQGFSTLRVFDREVGGKRIVAIFSGDTIVDKAYWGQTALQRTFVRYVMKKRLRHPFTRVYWFLITKGYRTYLLLSRLYPEYWPRHERETPAWEKLLIDTLATDLFGKKYLPDRGILKADPSDGGGRLRDGVAAIDQKALERPDIAFFQAKNPGHIEGDELCCIGKVDAAFLVYFTRKLAEKYYRRRSSKRSDRGVPANPVSDVALPSVVPVGARSSRARSEADDTLADTPLAKTARNGSPKRSSRGPLTDQSEA